MLFDEYLRNMPRLHSWDYGGTWNTGGFNDWMLEKLYFFLLDGLPEHPVFLETGAGNSTIAMLFLHPKRLISIAPDAQLFERIRGFCQENRISDAALEAHVDGSQWVLPRLAADNRTSDPILDFALIDGCHGWPTSFVDLEYANSMLRQGGCLLIDDAHLHAQKEMARFLSEHVAFSLALDLGKSLVFRKLTADRGLGDWWTQPYILRRTKQYAQLSNPYTLRDPPALNLTKPARSLRRLTQTASRVKRVPHRLGKLFGFN